MSATIRTIGNTQLGTAAAAIFTTSTGMRGRIQKLSFTNTAAATRTVSVWLVPLAGSNANATLLKTYTLAIGECWDCFEAIGQSMQSGGMIWANADAATSVTPNGSVLEMS
jgi:hypothetical protein